jgi:hypothetical protein
MNCCYDTGGTCLQETKERDTTNAALAKNQGRSLPIVYENRENETLEVATVSTQILMGFSSCCV